MEAKNLRRHVWSLTQENQATGITGMEEEFNVCTYIHVLRLHLTKAKPFYLYFRTTKYTSNKTIICLLTIHYISILIILWNLEITNVQVCSLSFL